jgi:hypothetical protein
MLMSMMQVSCLPAHLLLSAPPDVPPVMLHQVSTLDLLVPGRLGLNMLLICGTGHQQAGRGDLLYWPTAGVALQQQGWPVQVLQVLPASFAKGSSQQPQQHQQLAGLCQYIDVDGAWAALHSEYQDVAVLVRPDGHVAWRHLELYSCSAASQTTTGGRVGDSIVDQCEHELQVVLTDALCLNTAL